MCPYLIFYVGGRYCLYSRWKNDTYQQHAELLRKRGEAQKKIKSIMKRVSKENIKPVGRLIGKLTHCSPGFLFDYVCWNLELYILYVTDIYIYM
jgi:THO complex subunit 2